MDIVIQIHLGEHPIDGEGDVIPQANLWKRGDQVQVYLPGDVLALGGNIMRKSYAYVQTSDSAIASRLQQRKVKGERIPTEDIGTLYGDQGQLLNRSVIKYNLSFLSQGRQDIVDDITKDSPVMNELELPVKP